MKNKVLVFTGGGSGGHVIPALTLIEDLKKKSDIDIHYVGSANSIEERLTRDKGVIFHSIATGKLRRYISVENIKDMFKVALGILQAYVLLFKFKKKSTLIFSTGGFVSVPIVIAGALQGKKIFIHEQTSRVGLANKISSIFASKVFVSFEDSVKYFPIERTLCSGYPVRRSFFLPRTKSLKINGIDIFKQNKKIIFITGGGNGSHVLNEYVRSQLSSLENYLVVHQVGKRFINDYEGLSNESYICLDFLGDEMVGLMKSSDVILSRSGAGTVCELMALQKKSIFVPLAIAQKNEQYHNALAAQSLLGSLIVEEKDLSNHSFVDLIDKLNSDTQPELEKVSSSNGTDFLVNEIYSYYI